MGYIINNGEKDYKKIAENWELAIGLQQVDNLVPSAYLLSVAKQNIDGLISYEEVQELLYHHYEKITSEEVVISRQKECDIVSARIAEYLNGFSFILSPETLRHMHEYLFKDIYDFAGKYRNYNLSKKEPVLGGRTVVYADYRNIENTLAYDIGVEKNFDYSLCDKKAMIKNLSAFTSNIWQVHPFMEGNTRTTALFIECYLNTLGFDVNNMFFAEHAKFFRNALVRANYADFKSGIFSDTNYLYAFFENLIFNGTHFLKNCDLIVEKLVEKEL